MTTPAAASALETAHELAAAGLSVVPVATDGTKRPAVAWKQYTSAPATRTQIDIWWQQQPAAGVGVITGNVSNRLHLFEIEGRAAHHVPELRDLAHASGLGDLWQLINNGWLEISPSGGLHWLVYLDHDVPPNTKYAKDKQGVVLAESRGEGGFVVLAPSAGNVHPTGRPWVRALGGPTNAPTLTSSEREAVEALFQSLNQHEPATPTQPTNTPAWKPEDGLRPGDDFETKIDWSDILTPEGWEHVFTRGNTRYWRRPGKTDPGFSATTGHADDRDRLFVFTTSTDFEPETPYTKFGALALIHHGGDHQKCARALADGKHFGGRNFGEPKRLATTPPGVTVVEGISPFTPDQASTPTTPTAPTSTDTAKGTGTDGPALAPVVSLDQARAGEDKSLLHSDDANAQRLVQVYGHRIRYAIEWGRWLTWDGHRWITEPRGGGRVREFAKHIARQMPDTDKDDIKHKKYSQSAVGITNMLTLAHTDPTITVSIDDLDNRPWELNTPGGILDLTTGHLGPANPEHLHTKMTATTPDPDADTSVWDTFLTTTFPSNPELISYMQRLVGYSMVGEVREHLLPFAYGHGGNGKGVFLETLVAILGDYADVVPAGFLMANRFQASVPTDVADLKGMRFVVSSELNEGDRWDEAKVKQLTGGDTIKARRMRQDFFTFKPSHHLWIMGNHQPSVESGGDSFWRRLRLIPFTHKVDDEDRVEDLQTILSTTYGPAVLAWAAQGAAEYHRDGLNEPAQVKEATQNYAEDVDTVGRFLDEECITDNPHLKTRTTALLKAYQAWCQGNGEHAVEGRAFTTKLAHHGVQVGRNAPKINGQRYYGHVGLRSLEDDPDARTEPQQTLV
ncbi:phage/plasmid primase, P4 family [Zhihengliuella flava]|uniref:P4 family phage/plasmid primase-like protein n=1 Tax=Zhihengliuella flava TaxID=1285193 RepID=A0A931D9A1_9MICC|nr:phage/plasmid primase, P4 family [Zhihengliuella flava]MBG6083266.1 P4 family phage/plasmid primase-like protein [Zhihengliuella flava]